MASRAAPIDLLAREPRLDTELFDEQLEAVVAAYPLAPARIEQAEERARYRRVGKAGLFYVVRESRTKSKRAWQRAEGMIRAPAPPPRALGADADLPLAPDNIADASHKQWYRRPGHENRWQRQRSSRRACGYEWVSARATCAERRCRRRATLDSLLCAACTRARDQGADGEAALDAELEALLAAL